MAKTHKEQNGSVTRFVTESLDNVKQFIDRTSDEVAKADLIGANRRFADVLIDGTKDTFTKVADCANKREAIGAVRRLAEGMLDSAREALKVANEESQRINLMETGTKVTIEGLDLVRRELDIVFDATVVVGDALGETAETVSSNINNGFNTVTNMMPNFMGGDEPQKRPGVVTRVEIESDKTTTRTESHAGGGGGGKHAKDDKK
ncbi:MAG: hypothetical protein JWM80_6061 [Cyanobacteria bacterium RYN_339]|nr:hypothetical protein [Cyanobacteria bacterium RYN_339]